ncbi:laccase [Flagelloscypha sp. PMI_526]|nr:laccase [Flagelloscypha sp. PMI_526]
MKVQPSVLVSILVLCFPMAPLHCLILVVALAVCSVRASIGPVTDLTLTSASVDPLGSGVQRDAIVFSQSSNVIGPLIVGNKGDNFKINVINNLNNDNMRKPTSIHWHGILQTGGQNWADGAAFVTQCPIAGGGHSFLYDFTEPEQAGTFWYHSHLSTQYCDGARGPFVIYDPQDAHASLYDVDDESTVITLADWSQTYAMDFTGVPPTTSTLINGLGRVSGGTASPLSVITVEAGKRYRLRFINIACDPWYRVSIDGHASLTIIEADGVSTTPVTAGYFDIYAAQRYSVILNANQAVGNYWIRASPTGTSTFTNGIDSAILRYVGAPVAEPTTTPNILANLLTEQSLTPLTNTGAPGPHYRGDPSVKVFNLNFTFDGTRYHVNGVDWVPPSMPVLLQILSGTQTAQTLLPAGSFLEINQGDIVELNFQTEIVSLVGGPHPFHLHGHTFYVIRSAGSLLDNWTSPPKRDVVSTGIITDLVTIRFVADNKGPWFLHCHIDWHLELGLALVFAESVDQWDGTIIPPSEWDQLCPIYDALPSDDQ